MGGNDRPCPSLPIFYKYRENNELSLFSGGEKCVRGMIFDIFHKKGLRQTCEPDDKCGQPAPELHVPRVSPSIFTPGFT